MVIDDSPIDRMLVEKVIQRYEVAQEVIKMELAREALNYLKAEENREKLPDLIFLDINMPEIDGFGFLDQYGLLPEQVRRGPKIVMLTSSLHSQDRERSLSNPYVSHFTNKPLTLAVLQELELTPQKGN